MEVEVKVEEERKLPLGVKVAYGLGSVAYGVKNNGFDYFLLLFLQPSHWLRRSFSWCSDHDCLSV